LVAVLALLLAACAPATTPAPQATATQPAAVPGLSGEIPIGAVWSTTGAAAIYGSSQQKAAELAVEEINTSAMLGPATLKLITEDDLSTQ
jgi:branched-chain amino acid transport system substrate-binding protein